jgi:hypothetical protein
LWCLAIHRTDRRNKFGSAGGVFAGTYYITRLLTSLGELDQTPPLRELLGEEGWEKFLKVSAEAVAGSEYVLYRIVPELSSPTAAVAAVAPEFWNPKPKAVATPKSKAAETSKAAAKEKP